MIQIVMKPVPATGVVNRESLYVALFNGKDIGLRVRGLRASHAEEKLMEVFEKNISDKKGEDGTVVISYNLAAWLEAKKGSQDGAADAECAEVPGETKEESGAGT